MGASNRNFAGSPSGSPSRGRVDSSPDRHAPPANFRRHRLGVSPGDKTPRHPVTLAGFPGAAAHFFWAVRMAVAVSTFLRRHEIVQNSDCLNSALVVRSESLVDGAAEAYPLRIERLEPLLGSIPLRTLFVSVNVPDLWRTASITPENPSQET